LIARFIDHPDVIGIDIGYAPDRGEEVEELVLRVHVRERWIKASPETRVALPQQVEGISVVAILGKPPCFETDASVASGESDPPG
jgi:hypothetical protein